MANEKISALSTIATGSIGLSTAYYPIAQTGSNYKVTMSQIQTVALTSGTVTNYLQFPNTGLKVNDTDASHYLTIVPGSNLTDARTFTLITGDSDRTLSIGGDVTLPNTFTFSGNFTFAGTLTGTTTVTFPTSGTLATTAGNVATATALQTPRAINGVNFDGTANINAPINYTIVGNGGSLVKSVLNIFSFGGSQGTAALPASINAGDILIVTCITSGGLRITQGASQSIRGLNLQTTSGATGYVETQAGSEYGSITLVCTNNNTTFQVINQYGTWNFV